MFLQNAGHELILWWISQGQKLVESNRNHLAIITRTNHEVNNEKKSYMGYLIDNFTKKCNFFEEVGNRPIADIKLKDVRKIWTKNVPTLKLSIDQSNKSFEEYQERYRNFGAFMDNDKKIDAASIRVFQLYITNANKFFQNILVFFNGLVATMPTLNINIDQNYKC